MGKQEATDRIIKGLHHPQVTFLAHPTCRIIGQRASLDLDMEKILEAAVDTNSYLEINSFPDRLDLRDIHVKRGKEIGVKFVIGTDSHEARQLSFMNYGLSVARRGWLEATDCLNTKTTKELRHLFGGMHHG
jgi:DNA polymerase (family 10)